MTRLVKIVANEVVARVIEGSPEAIQVVVDALSFTVEGAAFSDAGRNGWNGKSSFFSHRMNTFPAGFVHNVEKALVQKGYTVRVGRKAVPEPLGPLNPIVDEFGNDDPRYDFQLKALRQVEKHKAGIIQVATGGGKSKIAKLIVSRFRRMTLFLTTRGMLMHQMAEQFDAQGFNVGYLGDGIWKPVRGVNVGMVQTLVAALKVPDFAQLRMDRIKKHKGSLDKDTLAQIITECREKVTAAEATRARTIKLLELFEVVIGEEAHEASGESYFEILRHCKRAGIRVALTATPFMREAEQDNMRLMAAFGPILIQVSEKLLIDRGILAEPTFKFVRVPGPSKLCRTTSWPRCYDLGYTTNAFLNGAVVEDAVKAAALKLPVMCLIQKKAHGDTIQDLMTARGLRARYIKGENNQAERKRALEQLKAGEIDVIIGTTILDVGVDVPAVGLVQLAGGGKAEIALRQRIGRGLRAKKSGPNRCFIADYSNDLNNYLREHGAQRKAIVEATPGFVERILPANDDFPWHIFEPAADAAA